MKTITGKQALVVVIVLIAILFYIVVLHDGEERYQVVNIFFASPDYRSLVREERQIRGGQSLKEKLVLTSSLLIYGNLGHDARSVIPLKTRLKSLFFFDGELHLNFSREFLDSEIPSSSKSIIVNSILATYFTSYEEIKRVYIYVEYRELNTIDGDTLFVYPYTREEFLGKFFGG